MAYEHIADHQADSNEDTVDVIVTGAKLNPFSGAPGERYIYVLYKDGRSRPTRIISTNHAPESWRLGTKVNVYDRNGAQFLGRYKVVGMHDHDNGEIAGDVPDRNDISHNVVALVY